MTSETGKCPRCQAAVPAGAVACPSCGAAVSSVPAPTVHLTGTPRPTSAPSTPSAVVSSVGPAPSRPEATGASIPAPKLATGEAAKIFAGRYEILQKLGQGAFGVVYRARDRVLDREVALKVLKLDRFPDAQQAEEYRQRFLREAQTVAKLRHANIVPVYDLGEAQGYYYIAMQLVTGIPLDEWLRQNGTMPAERVVRIGAQLADALGYAHSKGVIHRDIKPANVILEGDQPQIADFGIAKVQADPHQTRDDVIVGTLSYMSPEQLRGEELDGRSDLFSLGCVLLELLTKHRLFDGPNMTSIVTKIMAEATDLSELTRPDVAPGLVEILRKMLEKDREKRFANGFELREALEKLLPERQADTEEIRRLAAEVEKLKKEKQRANVAMVAVAVAGAAVYLGVMALQTNLVAFLPVFALASPAILIGVFYRDVLRKLNPLYWMLAGLFTVLVLVDSYYLAKLAKPATAIAASFKQHIPSVTLVHYDLVEQLIGNLFLVALVANILIVATRGRREKTVAWLNRVPVAATASALLAGLMVFMFSAMAGNWNAMMSGLNMQFAGAKIRQMEEEGRYEEVIEKFVGATKKEVLLDPAWQRRLARMYRVTGKSAEMQACWANLGQKLQGKWDPKDPNGYLAVGRDFARLDLYREDAATVLRKGLEIAPLNLDLTLELAKVYEKMGFPGEATAVKAPLMAPGGPLAPPETAASTAAPPATGTAAPAR